MSALSVAKQREMFPPELSVCARPRALALRVTLDRITMLRASLCSLPLAMPDGGERFARFPVVAYRHRYRSPPPTDRSGSGARIIVGWFSSSWPRRKTTNDDAGAPTTRGGTFSGQAQKMGSPAGRQFSGTHPFCVRKAHSYSSTNGPESWARRTRPLQSTARPHPSRSPKSALLTDGAPGRSYLRDACVDATGASGRDY